ncbi:MAG: hypothetical protein D6744_13605 [Planctomycetota bacterium]|nr:MAG: hypothetical protein D6744_13605 [Planctomycetota bacterium]
MWIDRLLGSPVTHGLQLTARYAEQRQQMLAENIANIDTPDYHNRRLDPEAFQKALHSAFETAERRRAKRLNLRPHAQFSTDRLGRLRVKPASEPAPNILFHDGTNARLEEMMADVQQNALTHQLALNLLRGRFDGLLTAIRGRLQ